MSNTDNAVIWAPLNNSDLEVHEDVATMTLLGSDGETILASAWIREDGAWECVRDAVVVVVLDRVETAREWIIVQALRHDSPELFESK